MARWPISPAAGRPSPSPRGDRSWARDLYGHPKSPRGPVPDAMPTSSCGPPAATIHENWASQLRTAFLSSWLAPAGSRGMQSFDISEAAGPSIPRPILSPLNEALLPRSASSLALADWYRDGRQPGGPDLHEAAPMTGDRLRPPAGRAVGTSQACELCHLHRDRWSCEFR